MPNFKDMSPAEFAAWQIENNNPPVNNVAVVAPPAPPSAPQAVPAAEVWGSNEFDFTCPSGATCRMRKLMPERLIEMGLLDKLTVLPGIAAEVVDKAEGAPPKKIGDVEIPDKHELGQMIELLNILVPMVVVVPEVHPVPTDGSERVVGNIYTDSIEMSDRVAIMERAVHGVKKLEPFRS